MHLITNTLLRWLTVFTVQFNADKPLSIVAVAFMEKTILWRVCWFYQYIIFVCVVQTLIVFRFSVEQSK